MECLAHNFWALWYVGYPDQAEQTAAKALTAARRSSNPLMVASVTAYTTWLYFFLRDFKSTYEYAQVLIDYCEDQAIVYWYNLGMAIQGWAMAHQGHPTAGINRLTEYFDRHAGVGSVLGQSNLLTMLADAYIIAEQYEDALESIDKALKIVEATNESWWLVETRRLKAKTYLNLAATVKINRKRKHYVEMAKMDLYSALQTAQNQGTKSLALRVASDMAELELLEEKRSTANQLLSEILNNFDEGFDTQDYLRAQSLLNAVP